MSGWTAFAFGALFGAALFDFMWRQLFHKTEELHRQQLEDARTLAAPVDPE